MADFPKKGDEALPRLLVGLALDRGKTRVIVQIPDGFLTVPADIAREVFLSGLALAEAIMRKEADEASKEGG